MYLVLLAYSGGVNKIEVKAKFIISCVDAVRCCAGNVGYYVSVFADICVY